MVDGERGSSRVVTARAGHGADDLAAALQRVVVELLEELPGHPEEVVHDHLRSRLRRHGLPLPPEPWLRTVAGEIAADRLYVVANGSVPPDYATSDAARRAGRRLSVPEPTARRAVGPT